MNNDKQKYQNGDTIHMITEEHQKVDTENIMATQFGNDIKKN